MKKAVEAAIVISISVLTVSTTATFIHNHAHQKQSMHLKASRTQMTAAADANSPRNQQSVTSATAHSANPVSTSTAAPPSEGSSIVQNWTSQDTQRFLSITNKLVHSLTPQDWSRIEQTLSQGNEHQAQIVLMTIANKYLTTSDETWVATHLAGNKPFGPVDVSLLQEAFKELQGQLTPTEQQLLQENHLL